MSNLNGAALLLVIGEPFTNDHKELILEKITKDLRTWDNAASGCDINEELQIIATNTPTGEEGPQGSWNMYHKDEKLTVEVLVNPQLVVLQNQLRSLFSAPYQYKHIVYAGHVMQGAGNWTLQDTVFTADDFSAIFKEQEVSLAVSQQNGGILALSAFEEGDWSNSYMQKQAFAKVLKVVVNPAKNEMDIAGLVQFSAYLSYAIKIRTLKELLQASDVVGNIRFSKPTLYIFPGSQGDSSLFGISGFNLLVNGGYSRKSCFWDFARHLDRIDSMLVSHLGEDNAFGFSTMLERKALESVHPEIGYVYLNGVTKHKHSPNGDIHPEVGGTLKPANLVYNLIEEADKMVENLHFTGHTPHPCVGTITGGALQPVNLYHKVGQGTLDMYILNPLSDSKELKDFLSQWNKKVNSFSHKGSVPLPEYLSICSLLVWKPANPSENITRILFPGNAPQNKIFEGLDKLKNLDFFQHARCSEDTLHAPKKRAPIGKATSAKSSRISARPEPEKKISSKPSTPRASTPSKPAKDAKNIKKAAGKKSPASTPSTKSPATTPKERTPSSTPADLRSPEVVSPVPQVKDEPAPVKEEPIPAKEEPVPVKEESPAREESLIMDSDPGTLKASPEIMDIPDAVEHEQDLAPTPEKVEVPQEKVDTELDKLEAEAEKVAAVPEIQAEPEIALNQEPPQSEPFQDEVSPEESAPEAMKEEVVADMNNAALAEADQRVDRERSPFVDEGFGEANVESPPLEIVDVPGQVQQEFGDAGVGIGENVEEPAAESELMARNQDPMTQSMHEDLMDPFAQPEGLPVPGDQDRQDLGFEVQEPTEQPAVEKSPEMGFDDSPSAPPAVNPYSMEAFHDQVENAAPSQGFDPFAAEPAQVDDQPLADISPQQQPGGVAGFNDYLDNMAEQDPQPIMADDIGLIQKDEPLVDMQRSPVDPQQAPDDLQEAPTDPQQVPADLVDFGADEEKDVDTSELPKSSGMSKELMEELGIYESEESAKAAAEQGPQSSEKIFDGASPEGLPSPREPEIIDVQDDMMAQQDLMTQEIQKPVESDPFGADRFDDNVVPSSLDDAPDIFDKSEADEQNTVPVADDIGARDLDEADQAVPADEEIEAAVDPIETGSDVDEPAQEPAEPSQDLVNVDSAIDLAETGFDDVEPNQDAEMAVCPPFTTPDMDEPTQEPVETSQDAELAVCPPDTGSDMDEPSQEPVKTSKDGVDAVPEPVETSPDVESSPSQEFSEPATEPVEQMQASVDSSPVDSSPADSSPVDTPSGSAPPGADIDQYGSEDFHGKLQNGTEPEKEMSPVRDSSPEDVHMEEVPEEHRNGQDQPDIVQSTGHHEDDMMSSSSEQGSQQDSLGELEDPKQHPYQPQFDLSPEKPQPTVCDDGQEFRLTDDPDNGIPVHFGGSSGGNPFSIIDAPKGSESDIPPKECSLPPATNPFQDIIDQGISDDQALSFGDDYQREGSGFGNMDPFQTKGFNQDVDDRDSLERDVEFDPAKEWGKPMGLPAPTPKDPKAATEKKDAAAKKEGGSATKKPGGATRTTTTRKDAAPGAKSATGPAKNGPATKTGPGTKVGSAKKTTDSKLNTTTTKKADTTLNTTRTATSATRRAAPAATKSATDRKAPATKKADETDSKKAPARKTDAKKDLSSAKKSLNTTTVKSDAKSPRPAPAKTETKTKPAAGAKRPATSSVTKTAPPVKLAPVTPFYLDLTYIPNHGNSKCVDLDFFRRLRARYYVFSALNPNIDVLNTLVEAKNMWEDKDAEVTIIPTYDTEAMRQWMSVKRNELAAAHIEVAPSANRCTIQLQDHETSCLAYRLEF